MGEEKWTEKIGIAMAIAWAMRRVNMKRKDRNIEIL